ncbi:conserved Plasmodium protein, unknown function [Plasmodium gallinaceum]|uniref:Uncharacterized protein n=1 Tax=Plasmodium gallinaceum TaxID=5849 RepID=A0A1J1GLF2_PLAGA|nr:conserved Plasmodium protein, unknown function [Plasmodium gallinaceum]CRG93193.1 conserved Plasmodium protein, unknown function [Plasmodium gallinaceum]
MDLKVLDDEIMLSDGRIIKIPIKNEENNKDKEKGKIKIEKIPNVWGSSAGAGSDYFDIYRKQRNEENERIELIEKKWKEYTENQIFQNKRKAKIEYIEKKRLKKKNKRLIKKNKLKQQQNNKKFNKNETQISHPSLKQNEKNKELNDDNVKTNEDHVKNNKNYNGNENNILDEEKYIEKEVNEDNGAIIPPIDTNNFLVVKEDELF